MSEQDIPRDLENAFDWQGTEDLTELPEGGLRDKLEELVKEEQAVSYRRRIIQGRIDLIRGELLRRGDAGLSPEDLARVLMDGPSREEVDESS